MYWQYITINLYHPIGYISFGLSATDFSKISTENITSCACCTKPKMTKVQSGFSRIHPKISNENRHWCAGNELQNQCLKIGNEFSTENYHQQGHRQHELRTFPNQQMHVLCEHDKVIKQIQKIPYCVCWTCPYLSWLRDVMYKVVDFIILIVVTDKTITL